MSADPTAPSVGARVKLHSLQQTPKHNGVEGEVLEFDASAGRWKIQLHPDGLLLALKASNLAVLAPGELMCGADVEIHSLVRSPELNGVRSKVVEPQDPGSGRWGVKIDSDGRVLALKPANLVLIRKHAPMVPRPRAQAGLTEEQRRLATRLNELQAADDWRGIAALEREALALAREAHPGVAGVAYSTLGKEQDRLVTRLNELQAAADWRGIAALEREALALARDVRGADSGLAGAIHGMLGNAYQSLGDFSQAIEHHTQDLAIAKEVGDRAGEGTAFGKDRKSVV